MIYLEFLVKMGCNPKEQLDKAKDKLPDSWTIVLSMSKSKRTKAEKTPQLKMKSHDL